MTTKFLVIRFSSIGDIVLTSPVVRCIKEQFKGDTEIHFITKKKFKPLVENNPNISKVIAIDDKVSEAKDELKSTQYDFVIDLHNNIRSAQVKRIVDAPSLTFNKINFQKWLKVNFKINKLPNEHIVERYLSPLNPFEITYDGKGLDYFFPSTFTFDLNAFELTKNHYVVISLGGTYFTKRLPTQKILELIPMLNKTVVLIGGKEDVETSIEIEKETNAPILNLTGKLALHESAFVVANAHSVVANDTGMMHIAAALKKPLASIWGNTIPEFGMYPLFPNSSTVPNKKFEVKNLKCRPCSKLGFSKCPKKHFKCMEDLKMEKVAEFLNSIN